MKVACTVREGAGAFALAYFILQTFIAEGILIGVKSLRFTGYRKLNLVTVYTALITSAEQQVYIRQLSRPGDDIRRRRQIFNRKKIRINP
jgi:hypothetical protein